MSSVFTNSLYPETLKSVRTKSELKCSDSHEKQDVLASRKVQIIDENLVNSSTKLPARLGYSRNFSKMGHGPKTQTRQAKLSQIAPGSARHNTTITNSDW